MNEGIIKQLAAEISAQINPAVPISAAFWSVKDIAACLSYTPRTARELTTRGDFPAPYFPGGTGQKRWAATEVLAWIKKFKGKEAAL